MSHLASSVESSDFDLMTIIQEGLCFLELDAEIVITNFEAKTDLFQLLGFDAALVLLQLLGTLVIVFTPISDFDNWWISTWRNLYQIEFLITSNLQGFCSIQNTQLLTVITDDPQAWRPNLFIQASILAADECSLNIKT